MTKNLHPKYLIAKSSILCAFLLLSNGLLAQNSTYTIVYNMFQSSCAVSCHKNGNVSGGLNLAQNQNTVYSSLMAAPTNPVAAAKGDKLIDPGYPHRSFLFRKCNNGLEPDNGLTTGEGNPMPPGPALSNKNIEIIRQWILKGAPQNGNVVDTALVGRYYNGLGTVTMQAPAAPLSNEGFQIHLGKFFVPEGSETEFFLKYNLKLPDTLEVKRIDVTMTTSSHHFIIYKFKPNQQQNYSNGIRTNASHANTDIVSAFAHSYDLQLPQFTAYNWEQAAVLDFNYHIINYYPDSVLGAETYINVYTQPKGTALNIMNSVLVPNLSISIPFNSQEYTFTTSVYDNTAPPVYNVWMLGSHTHKYGTDYDIFLRNPDGTTGQQIYEGFYDPTYTFNQGYYDWQHPPIRLFEPMLQMNPQVGFVHTAKFRNTAGPNPVTFGLTSSDEMMLFYLQYTIGNFLVGTDKSDANSNGISLSAFPNPSLGNFTLSYHLANKAEVSIEIVNVVGERIATINEGWRDSGRQNLEINLADKNISPGIYFLKLNAGSEQAITKVVYSGN